MQEDTSFIITADVSEEPDKLWPRKGLGTLQLVFFAVVLIHQTRMEPAEAVETTQGWYVICSALLSCTELKSVSLKQYNSLFRPHSN